METVCVVVCISCANINSSAATHSSWYRTHSTSDLSFHWPPRLYQLVPRSHRRTCCRQ